MSKEKLTRFKNKVKKHAPEILAAVAVGISASVALYYKKRFEEIYDPEEFAVYAYLPKEQQKALSNGEATLKYWVEREGKDRRVRTLLMGGVDHRTIEIDGETMNDIENGSVLRYYRDGDGYSYTTEESK